MGTYDRLTRYLPLLEKGPWGKTVQEPAGADGVLHLPHVEYTDTVCSFVQELYQVWEEQRELADYQDVLRKNGLNDIWQGAGMAERLDGPCVLALMIWTLRAERFSPGALLSALEAGHIQSCLSRLAALRDQNKDRRAIKMSKLFKDRTNEESYASLLKLLRGDRTICELTLLGITDPMPYDGKPNRSACSGLEPEKHESDWKEKRICKCLYYYNRRPLEPCHPNCDYVVRDRRRRIQGEYTIKDYEIPAYSGRIKDVGKVDMILEGPSGDLYATEVKPPEGNPESLLRMIAEIVTYTLCGFKYEGKETQRAIAFFSGSDQEREYNLHKDDEDLKTLLEETAISVFCFQEVEEEKAYKICKL